MEEQPDPPQMRQPLADEPQPVLHPCVTFVRRFTDAYNRTHETIRIVNEINRVQAYETIDGMENQVPADDRVPESGVFLFCRVLEMVEGGGYQEMLDGERCKRVAIKRVEKSVLGGGYNPYREIDLMQRYGDNIHVLGCIEALYDDTYIYIVMPYCDDGSLLSSIPGEGFPEDEAREWFQQILDNLRYLRERRICHRDLSPDHCMMYQGRVVFSYLALSFQLPPNVLDANGTVNVGNPAYQPPEVFLGREPYNAYGCDLWAAVVTLFYMLTGVPLYNSATETDIFFIFFIWASGLSTAPLNNNAINVLRVLNEDQVQTLLPIFERSFVLSPNAREILGGLEIVPGREIVGGVLRMTPDERWGIDEVAASAFMNPPM